MAQAARLPRAGPGWDRDDLIQVGAIAAWRLWDRGERRIARLRMAIFGAVIDFMRARSKVGRTPRAGRPGLRRPYHRYRDLLAHGSLQELRDREQEPSSMDPGFVRAERRADLELMLRALSPVHRATVWLRYFEDLTERQIGALYGVTESAICHRLRAAIAQMRAPSAG